MAFAVQSMRAIRKNGAFFRLMYQPLVRQCKGTLVPSPWIRPRHSSIAFRIPFSSTPLTSLPSIQGRSVVTSSKTTKSRNSQRSLPLLPDRRPFFLLVLLVAIATWTSFTQYATNKERMTTSVFRAVVDEIKASKSVEDALGDPVLLVPGVFGDPWVRGSINMMQGRIDISFRIKGSRGEGTAYFTSIRPSKEHRFEILRFLVVPDDTTLETISLLNANDDTSAYGI